MFLGDDGFQNMSFYQATFNMLDSNEEKGAELEIKKII